jgi:hypothetical protein
MNLFTLFLRLKKKVLKKVLITLLLDLCYFEVYELLEFNFII